MRRRSFLLLSGASFIGLQKFRFPQALALTQTVGARKLKLNHPLADPFCLKWEHSYYLMGTYSTGRPGHTGRAFDLLISKDLDKWESLGPVLAIPEYEGSRKANYWAPEILPREDKFYLYYTSDSFGDPYRRFVRVAVSNHIEGPYQSDGRPLTEAPSIDGHPVYTAENDGFLFYTGNEGNPNMGQLLVDQLASPTQLEGNPARVFPNETVEWEEGSFILQRNNEYYLFSSQGNWRNGTYHVLVAKSKTISGPYDRISYRRNRLVLQSSDQQIGPGHNSLFEGPGGQTYICYHAWDKEHTGRYAWIAPLAWDKDFPLVGEVSNDL
ncbi:MAG: family 43 glycosylhydrolase [bacterium]